MSASFATPPQARLNWPMIILCWLIAATLLVVRSVWLNASIPLIADTDDAMRLTMVRDLMAGQNWFDHVQHRLNTPLGGELHWSRLIDLPIAGLIALLSLLPQLGDPVWLASIVYPLILLLILLILSAKLVSLFVPRQGLLPALLLPLLSAIIMFEFAPGRVDHHNMQILLVLAMALTTLLARSKPIIGALTGLILTTSLAIGTETIPMVAATIAAFALLYVFNAISKSALAWFGLSLILTSLGHLALALPFDQWLTPACDALSITYVVAASGAGLVLLILAILPINAPVPRLGVGIVLGGALIAGLLVLFPQCLGGPYQGMDPWLAENWIGRIIEAKPIWYSFEAMPAYTLGIAVPPVLAFIATLIAAAREPEQRVNWLVLALFLGLGIAVMILQVRGARLLAALVAPAGAYAIVAFRTRYVRRQSYPGLVGLILSWFLFAGVGVSVIASILLPVGTDELPRANLIPGNDAAHQITKYDCLAPDAFVDLAALPPERIMAPVDLGAHILLYTQHHVVGAPYHRVQDGVLDTFNFFNRSVEEAFAIAKTRGISLVVTCAPLGEMSGFADTDEDALVHRLKSDDLPSWLTLYSAPDALLKVYGVEY